MGIDDGAITPVMMTAQFSAIAEEPSTGAFSTLAEGPCSDGQSTSHLSLSPSSPGGSSYLAMSPESLRKLRSVGTPPSAASDATSSARAHSGLQQLQHSSSGLRVDRDSDQGTGWDPEAGGLSPGDGVQRDARPPPDPAERRGSCPPPGMPSCPHIPLSPATSGVIAPPRLLSPPSEAVSSVDANTPSDQAHACGRAGSRALHQHTPLSFSLRDSDASASSAPPTVSVKDFRDHSDSTRRALDCKRTSSLAALGASMASLIAPPQFSSFARRRRASVSRRWDQSSLDAAAAAAALGGTVDTGLYAPMPAGAQESTDVDGDANPAAILRSLSVGHRPRYYCQSRTASAEGHSAGVTESYYSPPAREHAQASGLSGGGLIRRLFKSNKQRSPAPDHRSQQGLEAIVVAQQQVPQQHPPPSLPPTPPDELSPEPPLLPSIELQPEIIDEQRQSRHHQLEQLEEPDLMCTGSHLISAGV